MSNSHDWLAIEDLNRHGNINRCSFFSILQEKQCKLNANSVCGCDEGFYQAGEGLCKEIPKCQENYELHEDYHPGNVFVVPYSHCKLIENENWA